MRIDFSLLRECQHRLFHQGLKRQVFGHRGILFFKSFGLVPCVGIFDSSKKLKTCFFSLRFHYIPFHGSPLPLTLFLDLRAQSKASSSMLN